MTAILATIADVIFLPAGIFAAMFAFVITTFIASFGSVLFWLF